MKPTEQLDDLEPETEAKLQARPLTSGAPRAARLLHGDSSQELRRLVVPSIEQYGKDFPEVPNPTLTLIMAKDTQHSFPEVPKGPPAWSATLQIASSCPSRIVYCGKQSAG